MPSGMLFALALAGALGRTLALRTDRWSCPADVATIVKEMTQTPQNAVIQTISCQMLGGCIRTELRADQDAAVAAGSLEASVAAMRNFPDNKELQKACIGATARPILFNRENGLLAGRLGGLNLTLAAYRKWIDDPAVTSHGGDIGCYLDYCDENRAILRELGGVHLVIQNIKNNFHGAYSEWAYESVKNSLYALSSGCWKNTDLCYEEGILDLGLKLMEEHTSADKIAEETLQVTKAMMFESDAYRAEFSRKGLARVLAKVLKENPRDRGAVSLACENVKFLVGPSLIYGPSQETAMKAFDEHAQATATREGLLAQLLSTAMSGATLEHKEHGGFNFNIDESYNSAVECQEALSRMGYDNEANSRTMLQTGLSDFVVEKLRASSLSDRARRAGCELLLTVHRSQSNATALKNALRVLQKVCRIGTSP